MIDSQAPPQLTFGSLFAGIGGIDLGLERAGMSCAWQVEIDEYARRVLAKHWPDVPRFGDIRDCGAHNLAPVDLICGGFPCQDISGAGRRAGIDGERSGLWSEYARIVGELRPRYVLVENVAALLVRGMGRVLGDLAAIGYDAEWSTLSACALGAPHTRERLFIIAHPHRERRGDGRVIAPHHAVSPRSGWKATQAKSKWQDVERWISETVQAGMWSRSPAKVQRVADGVPARLVEDRLRGLGNAVVPQVAEFIGRCILDYEASL
jgi:DNA (cytosine-5)-methyltransferase 1